MGCAVTVVENSIGAIAANRTTPKAAGVPSTLGDSVAWRWSSRHCCAPYRPCLKSTVVNDRRFFPGTFLPPRVSGRVCPFKTKPRSAKVYVSGGCLALPAVHRDYCDAD